MLRGIEALIQWITSPMRQLYVWLSKCIPGISFLRNFTLPFKWAMISLLFLLLIWVGCAIKTRLSPDIQQQSWIYYLLWPSPALVIIPLLVYHFVRIWMIEEKSRYPEIDEIWGAGVAGANQLGIYIDDSPIFLVLGTGTTRAAAALLKSAKIETVVQSPQSGEGPISFFAAPHAIFVFLHDCSCISLLSKSPTRSVAFASPHAEPSSGDFPAGGTVDASFFENYRGNWKGGSPAGGSGGTVSGTMFPNASPDGGLGGGIDGGTMIAAPDWATSGTTYSNSVRSLTSNEIDLSRDKLSHFCRLLWKTRFPCCPMNGLLTTLPFELVEQSSGPLLEAMQRDVAVIREELQVRAANTVLVTGMEIDSGFIELMNRFKPQQLSDFRFGKGSDHLWACPDAERLGAIAVHASAQFEDWIYMFFQSEQALKRKHNTRLYQLLCRIRGGFASSLKTVIAGGLGVNLRTDPHLAREQPLFSGCYFAATGSGPSEQAFVKNVISKIVDQQGELEWLRSAIETDRRYMFFANLAALVGLASLLSIIGMIAYYYYVNAG